MPIQRLLLLCSGGCQDAVEVEFGLSADDLVKSLAAEGWFLSLMTPPGVRPVVSAATCRKCAERLMPEVVKEVLLHREKKGRKDG